MDKLLDLLSRLRNIKFTGSIIIHFNQGGVRSVKKFNEETIDLN